VNAYVPRLVFFICSLTPAIAFGHEVIVLKSFPGDAGPGPKDNPDNTGGVGPRHTAIPKMDAIAADGPELANMQSFSNLEIESFPATDINPSKSPNAPEIILNREFGNSFSRMYLYKVAWAGKAATISGRQTIPLRGRYVSPNGGSLQNQAVQPAPGGRLRADEARRTTCVFSHGGSIFSCNSAKKTVTSRCGVFWCEIRASDGVLLQEGFVDAPDRDYLAPSLAVDANGNIGVGCTRTSETEFPSVCVLMHAAGDPKDTMRRPSWPQEARRSFRATVRAIMGWHGETTIPHVSTPRTRQSFGLTRNMPPVTFLRNIPPAGLRSSSGPRHSRFLEGLNDPHC
jgi:hypothetical protein